MKIFRRILLIIFIISIAIIMFLGFQDLNNSKKQKKYNEEVIKELEKIIPKESLGKIGDEKQLSTFEVKSNSYVGILKLNSIKENIPILSGKTSKQKYGFFLESYNQTPEKIVILSDKYYGSTDELLKLKEFDEITFIDVRGEERVYTITSITNVNEDIANSEENLVIKIKNFTSWVTIRANLNS